MLSYLAINPFNTCQVACSLTGLAIGNNTSNTQLLSSLNGSMSQEEFLVNLTIFHCNQDGTVSLQILESSQIDKSNDEYVRMFKEGTHFNPVDLVCATKDYKGRPFHLPDFVDKSTGFISSKSKNGKELKALELPGLWNGAMSDWNTVFVEVPISTFNPVKTVNDLLREQHQ